MLPLAVLSALSHTAYAAKLVVIVMQSQRPDISMRTYLTPVSRYSHLLSVIHLSEKLETKIFKNQIDLQNFA